MVDLVKKTNLKLAKLASFNIVMTISSYFYFGKKVRSFASLSGPLGGLSARLTFKSAISRLNFRKFANIMRM